MPSQAHRTGMEMEVIRDDLEGEPTLAVINCQLFGNWAHKANHSCDKNTCAIFRGMLISGRFRIMLVAARDIFDKEKITVHYGNQYWVGHRKNCACNSEDCISRELGMAFEETDGMA